MSRRSDSLPPDERPRPPDSVPTLREPRYSQSLERGLAILAAFKPNRPVLGIADIAEELGMSRSTTHRYVITLLALGYLEQGAARKYRLGLGVTRLGMAALSSTPLGEHARPYLEELRTRYTYSANLGVLDGDEVVLVQRVRGLRPTRHALELETGAGSRFPAHCSAMGKLLLANLPEPHKGRLLSAIKLERRGPNTITDKRRLRAELDRIRDTGLATSAGEIAAHLNAIAAPVYDEAGEVLAAVNVFAHGSTASIEELVETLGPQLRSAGDHISARLGYRRPDAEDQ